MAVTRPRRLENRLVSEPPAESPAVPEAQAHAYLVPREAAAANRYYQPELDVLRLIAFCLVWCAHVSMSFRGLASPMLLVMTQGIGSFGVPIFFFLSAFLITELLRREQAVTGTIHLRFFYLRRVLRIWPLYLGVLLVYAMLGLYFHGFRIEPGRLIASCLLAGNWYMVAHPAITTPLRSLWSISVEEQWYLLWPFLFCRLSPRILLLVCVAFVCLAQSMLVLAAGHSPQGEISVTAWNNSVVQFQYFAYGASVALLLRGQVPALSAVLRCGILTGGIAAFALAAGPCGIKRADVPHTAWTLCAGYLMAGVGACACFFALYGLKQSSFPHALVRLGQLSFGLYLLHETALFLTDECFRKLAHASLPAPSGLALLLEKGAALGLTIGLAFVSYHLWELPFLKLKQRWTIIQNRPVV